MSIKRGVSLYSYQQSQFFHELDLEAQIREVGGHLDGADGIELIDEMSLHYPNPGSEFVRKWFGWMDRYGTVPVTLDVGMDVLQFRDHVMTHDECAERLRHDIHLARFLGFRNVRVLSVVPLDVLVKALPLAEALDIRLGKEIHQPMTLEGPQVAEIIEYVERTGTRHLGIVPDLGIFQTRPSEVLLAWFQRRGAQTSACEAAVELAKLLETDSAPFKAVDAAAHTAGNVRSQFTRFLVTGQCESDFTDIFAGVKQFTDSRVEQPTDVDYTVVAEALMLSRTSGETLRKLARHVVGVHGKFYNMSPVPGKAGQYQDISIDYPSAIKALKEGGFDGYINSEYEGQRYFQDRGREDLMSEVEQVRRHQEMLGRLIAA
ncbi:sugar phosphate isomerase/epimerase [Burkholderia multivorans]|uniref:sugar phosphate isomerase/epimerase n=1 Tax=Burkholderia multivorans TaxID=87883 RepID=UPI001C22DD09|nr:sugar phosphate isomerase/epimerase [Burkholderia multivorans]MBU9205428.1 sugar phosphate isomerase/epimerase [Burkholderia multivorans]MCO8353437.1 hypothetical protein [Burkholderia multivorans]MCO8385696.1 hypothetical protein [Burkholderia multivorans]MCO8406623.1 hypothetical protein [Burkholderia multivorans]MCO8434792.1 hypothetical protein [Burkholderia multivorans]